MAELSYNGEIINSAVSGLVSTSNEFNSLALSIKQGTNEIVSARGFDKYIGGISNDTFSKSIIGCQTAVKTLVQMIRQTQVQILSYSQDDDAIQMFFDSLDNEDYKNLDLSGIEDHISISRKAGNFLKGLGSDLFTFGAGFIEGVLDFGETGCDLVCLGSTAISSIFTSCYDALTGENVTEQMWKDTKAFVSKKKVESVFNSFYDNTEFGQEIKRNAYGFESVRGVGKGIGYTSGVIALTSLTGGLGAGAAGSVGTISTGQLALTAGLMGFSNGTEEAWADGANIENGLIYGTASGAWESVQWTLGGKINKLNSVGARVLFDSLDAGAEGFVQPGLKMLYKDYAGDSLSEQYKNAFIENGGWGTVATQAVVGGVMSASSEIFNSVVAKKSSKNVEIEEEFGFFDDSKAKDLFKSKIKKNSSVASSLSGSQIRELDGICDVIRKDGSYTFTGTNQNLTSEMLKYIDENGDLSKVTVSLDSAFRDANGIFQSKYNKSSYIERVTFSGREALTIITKLEDLQSRVDMSLPTVDRARQIYEMIASEYSYFSDYRNSPGGHQVVASLRGITSNNVNGREGIVCAGYAQLYKNLCDRCGIKCDYVRGKAITESGSVGHAWNVIFDESGESIPVDCTWKSGNPSGDYFGRSTDFAASHIADADEIFRDYAPKSSHSSSRVSSSVISGSQPVRNSSFGTVISTMDSKYGSGAGVKALKKYLDTDNLNLITRANDCRQIVGKMSKDDIFAYLLRNDSSTAMDLLSKIDSHMTTKYGVGAGITAFQRYINGNAKAITRDNNYRMLIENIPKDIIKNYLYNN